MAEETLKSPEDILRDELLQVETVAQENASKSREIAKSNQLIFDQARAIRGVLEIAPGVLDIETQIILWNDVNNKISPLAKHLGITLGLIDDSSSTTNIAIVSGSSSAYKAHEYISNLPAEKQQAANLALENLDNILSNPDYKEEAITLLKHWSFDKAVPGKKSPFELFLTAFSAFEQPVVETNPVSTSLIPMRECIRSIIDELLRRKSKQEKCRGYYKKIISISSQTKKDSVSLDVVEEWAHQGHELIKSLSLGKEGSLERTEWQRQLQQATLFLISLLKGLDPEKMKPIK